MVRRRIIAGLNLTEFLIALVLGVIGLVDMYQNGQPWWIALVLLLALLALISFWPKRPFQIYYLLAESSLVLALLAFHPIFGFLCISLSATVISMHPNRFGAIWIAVLTLLSGGVVACAYQADWFETLLTTLFIACGYGGMGAVIYSRERAEEARDRAEALLEELQAAHRQLQEYAGQVEELAVAEERNRLAREMHDTLGHRLTVAAVQLEGAQRLIPRDPERAAHMVGTVRDQVREALEELRRTVATLRTPLEVDLSLPLTLARLAVSFEKATGLPVHLALPEEMPDLPDPHRLALYRAAQEALTNVQRHAQAGEAWLQLTCENGEVILRVEDDGVGVPAGAEEGGFGLRGLRERAAQLGGELALESKPSGGTQLSFHLPLPVEEDDG